MVDLVSIIIPNFNKSPFISETIKSVLSQSLIDWELLIIDDNSSDKSWSIIESYGVKDQRIKAFRNNSGRKGASVCRNIGLKKANGNFVIFLDSDDLLSPSCLENRIKEITSFPKLDFMVFSMGTFYAKIGDSSSTWIPPEKNHLEKILAHDLPWSIVQPIWKKEFLINLNGFDESFSRLQDVEMHTRALLYKSVNYAVSSKKNPDCYYRISEERKTVNSQLFYSNWINSVVHYIDKTRQLLIAKSLKSKTHLLKGTLIKTITSILHAEKNNEIDAKLASQFIDQLPALTKDLIETKVLLKTYIILYKMGFYKIKGFNYLFYKLFIYV